MGGINWLIKTIVQNPNVRKILFITLVAVYCILLPEPGYPEEPHSLQEHSDTAMYFDLGYIQRFKETSVYLQVESNSILDIDKNKLTAYLKNIVQSKFNKRLELDKPSSPTVKFETNYQKGVFECYVWIVGNDYPLSYHISCNGGSMIKRNIWQSAYLGYTNSQNINEVIKNYMTQLADIFAEKFFAIRGNKETLLPK